MGRRQGLEMTHAGASLWTSLQLGRRSIRAIAPITMRVMTPDRVLTSDGAPDVHFFVIFVAVTSLPHRHA